MSSRQPDRRMVTILLIVFVQVVGASMILPILPLFARKEFDLADSAITPLVSVFYAAQFIAGPWLGQLSDRYGRIPVLIVSQVGTVASFLMLGLAPSAAFLFAARVLDGITGGNFVVAQAYITDITPREKRTESLGFIFAAMGVGFIVGPAIGGILAALFGPRIPYFFAAAAAAIVVVLTYFTLEESLTLDQREKNRASRRGSIGLRDVLGYRVLLVILVAAFLAQFAFGMLQSTFSFFGEDVIFAGYSEQAVNLGIGLLLATIGLGQVVTQTAVLPRAVKRFGEARLVNIGVVIRAAGLFTFALVAGPFAAVLPGAAFALGTGLLMPSLQSLATTAAPDEIRGGVLGIFQSAVNLGIIFSTAIAGAVYSLRPTAPFLLGGGLMLLVLLPGGYLLRLFGSTDARKGPGRADQGIEPVVTPPAPARCPVAQC